MRKLAEVQEARAVMTEAMEWSVFKWLFEKSRVRETADQAKAALDAAERAVKAHWSNEVKAAYRNLTAKATKAARKGPTDARPEQTVDRVILDLLEKVVEADNVAERAGMDAENTFDEAEAGLSTTLAREGCKKAMQAWALREKAIRKAEVVVEALRAETAASSVPGDEE